MLHNIIFQDNIYQLTRSIELLSDGLQLDLTAELFKDKIINDVLFFDFATQKLFNKIESQPQLPDYTDSMHCLYFCAIKYVNLINFITHGDSESAGIFKGHFEKLEAIRSRTEAVIDKIRYGIQIADTSAEKYSMVSQNELAELLNCGNI